jgi:hypothetical protein
MLFAVPPSSSHAAFFVLSAPSFIAVSLHFRVSLLYTPFIPFHFHSFQSLPVQWLLLFMARLRVASGCGLSLVKVELFWLR